MLICEGSFMHIYIQLTIIYIYIYICLRLYIIIASNYILSPYCVGIDRSSSNPIFDRNNSRASAVDAFRLNGLAATKSCRDELLKGLQGEIGGIKSSETSVKEAMFDGKCVWAMMYNHEK